MNMTFEEFVRNSVDKGEYMDKYMPKFWRYTRTTKNMLTSTTQNNRTFIYNYEDNRCYYFYDKKLYRLSVNFEEVDSINYADNDK